MNATLEGRILSPENGFLLGNGDLSVSLYQTETALVWRFGKGDVWDRRLDLRDDPPPAHISEVSRGILEEGWQVGTTGDGLTALKGSRDEMRMREICQGSPMSYETRPYPCPKPVGELAMHLPPDLTGLNLTQTLSYTDNQVVLRCSCGEQFDLRVTSWIDPEKNVLTLHWEGTVGDDAVYGRTPPVWFSLYRWADPAVEDFAAAQYSLFRTGLVTGANDPAKASPLPPPSVERRAGLLCVEQRFYPERTYPDGFVCLLAPLNGGVEAPSLPRRGEAALHILPSRPESGCLTIAVSTGSPEEAEQHLAALACEASAPGWAAASQVRTREASRRFWEKSSFHCGEPLLERLWYDSLHAFRCAYRGGAVPPGLFFPSTVRDYAHWHGDYHSNYNFQTPFWGICAANHPEGLKSYADGMEYFFRIGRRIARDYYGCRGVFVQLSAFPIDAEDDPIGVVPLGRMVYMTGWAATLYWQRYLYTLDREWLERVGYPAIRDCALFFTDFLKLGPDGRYHAFPSIQGEEAFTGDPRDSADRPEVSGYLCYCLRAAIQASEALETDEVLREEWRKRLLGYAADPAAAYPPGSPERLRAEENPPEYGGGSDLLKRTSPGGEAGWPTAEDYVSRWYFGHYSLLQMKRLHLGRYRTETDFPQFLRQLRRWRCPNGLFRAMSASSYGIMGAWTESLAVLGVLEELLLQSWDGVIRLFPGLPPELDAGFHNLRARGAFLLSAAQKGGMIEAVTLHSERGGVCRLLSPWAAGLEVRREDGSPVPCESGGSGCHTFRTEPGQRYRLTKPGEC